ncbi:MAG TPA: xanthine dehydrogenase family protein subunit M [Candidatus Limnocylindrales bacterium]|nr:xanthine dehydrogenase family protein subunit M [Candidatus Limnocylindrales bacterium]
MKPAPFAYRDPHSLDEALALLDQHGDEAVVLAGGQSLVPLLNLRLSRPAMIVDVNRIPGLDGITVDDGGVEIGCLARASAVEWHQELFRRLPVMAAALHHVGHPQIRNRTTIGGNLAHADPASELPAVMAALDGEIRLTSPTGVRRLRWDEFFIGPFSTARQPQELVTSAWLPLTGGLCATFQEVARRHGDFAVVGACVACREQDGVVAEARIALCGVSGTPLRVRAAERAITGRPVDADSLAQLGEAVRGALDPPADIHASAEYRREVGATIVSRALAALWEGRAAGH